MVIFLDSCIIIYWVESVDTFYEKVSKAILKLSKTYGRPNFAVSRLSVMECRVHPLRAKDHDLLQLYEQFFSAPNLEIVDVSSDIIDTATALRAHHQLKSIDAVLMASAISLGKDTLFLSNDKQFKNLPFIKVKII